MLVLSPQKLYHKESSNTWTLLPILLWIQPGPPQQRAELIPGWGKISLLGLFHLISVEGTLLPFQGFWWFQSRDIAKFLISYSSPCCICWNHPHDKKKTLSELKKSVQLQAVFCKCKVPWRSINWVTIFLVGTWPLLKCHETAEYMPMDHLQMKILSSYHWLSTKTHSS